MKNTYLISYLLKGELQIGWIHVAEEVDQYDNVISRLASSRPGATFLNVMGQVGLPC